MQNLKLSYKILIYLLAGIVLEFLLGGIYALVSSDTFGLGGFFMMVYFGITWLSLGLLFLGTKMQKTWKLIFQIIGIAGIIWIIVLTLHLFGIFGYYILRNG